MNSSSILRSTTMCPLTRLKALLGHLEFARGHTVPADAVIEAIAPVIEEMEDATGGLPGEWLSLSRAMERSGRSATWFREPLDTLGGKSRLKAWEASGLARQEGRAWFISAQVVPSSTKEVTVKPHRQHLRASHAGPEDVVDADDALVNAFNQFLDEAA